MPAVSIDKMFCVGAFVVMGIPAIAIAWGFAYCMIRDMIKGEF